MRKSLLFISAFLLQLLSSCGNSIDNNDTEFEIVEPEITPLKADYTISWNDSNNVKLSINKNISFEDIQYDSALIVFYWGYVIGDSANKSYAPINEKGQWISTILKKAVIFPKDLYHIDSLLSDSKTFDDSLNPFHFPKLGILYFKNGNIIGHVSLGLESIKSTIRLGNEKYFSALKRDQFNYVHYFLEKKYLNLY